MATITGKRGRPSTYGLTDPILVATEMGRLGATNEQLAAAFGITKQGFQKWLIENPKLVAARKDAKAQADAAVEKSLFQRANGYTHDDVHISQHDGKVIVTKIKKHYPPDTTACIFWLKNRQPENWRDVHRIHHEGNLTLTVEDMSAEELRADMIKRGELTPEGRLVAQRN